MINPTGKKLEKLLFGMFDDAIQGVDRYNHNGCLWLIFTDEMRWVVEYTKTQTLWYNYYFFEQEMVMVGLDCVDNKDLIQKWFESRFLNIEPVEYDIQNGVIQTQPMSEWVNSEKIVDKTIQNGVKETKSDRGYTNHFRKKHNVDGVIQNGVKSTFNRIIGSYKPVEDTIQNGVKNTYSDKIPHEYDWSDQFTEEIEDTIQNGVKEIYEITYQFIERVEDTIKSGVKKILSGDDDYDHPVRDTIQNGVKETCKSESTKSISLRRAIQNGVKHCEDGDWLDGDERFEDIIQNGEKK